MSDIPAIPRAPGQPPAGPAVIDWGEVRRFVRLRVRHTAPSLSDDDVEELTQETLVKLLRLLGREEVRNAEALMNEVARRTTIDHLRSRSRWSRVLEPWDGLGDPGGASEPPLPLGDPVERLRFVALEYFTARSAPCAALVRALLAGFGWDEVAARTQRSAAAVRKQWSRCAEALREHLRGGPGALRNLLPPGGEP